MKNMEVISIAACMFAVLFVSISASPLAGASQHICANSSKDFLPHPTNTSKYIICNNGTATEASCFIGLVFDPVKEACWWAEDALESGEIKPRAVETASICVNNSIHFLPHPTNTSIYFICHNGTAYEMFCPEGLVYDPENEVCWWKDVALDSGEISPKGLPRIHGLVPVCHNNSAHFLPHPTNPQKYFICQNGTPVVGKCPNGFVFDSVNSVCWWPEDLPENEEVAPEALSRIHGLVPVCHNNSVHFLPHPTNPSKYYVCHNGIPSEATCPDGLVFDPVNSICWWPEDVIESGEDVDSDEIKPRMLLRSMPTAPVCANNSVHYLPHNHTISKYFMCKNGIAVEMTCPGNLVFFAELSACWYINDTSGQIKPRIVGEVPDMSGEPDMSFEPDTADLRKADESDGIKPTETSPVCTDDSFDFLPHPDDVTKFFMCKHGVAHEKTCPTDLVFLPEVGVCWWADANDSGENKPKGLARIQETSPVCANDSIHFLPHPENISKFYMCKNGAAHEMSCLDGLVFVPEHSVCWFPGETIGSEELKPEELADDSISTLDEMPIN